MGSRKAVRHAAVVLSDFPPLHQTLLRNLAALVAPSKDAFVVGGAIRDLLLSRHPPEDLDLAVPAGALQTAETLAIWTGGRYVCLDAERGAARVVLRLEDRVAQVDLTEFRGPSIEGDLRGRDLTINALAVPLPRLVEEGSAGVVDPTGGLADLARRRLRLAGPASFAEDPVRALRAIRLAGEVGFSLDPGVRRAARAVQSRLGEVAPERIRAELAGVLALPRTGAALRELDRLGLLTSILPESGPMKSATQPAPHRFTVWEHSLRAVEAADRILADLGALTPYQQELAAHMSEPLGDSLTRREVLKLAILLHDVAKPETHQRVEGRIRFIGHDKVGAEKARAIAQRLRLSNAATTVLVQLVRHHLRPMHLGQLPEVSRRARYRFFRDLGAEVLDLFLLTLADAAAVRGASPRVVWRGALGRLVADLMAGWEEDRQQASTPPLLRGEDVMVAFGLASGPEVGRLLAMAREAQDLGVVSTREEALALLTSHADANHPLAQGERAR